MNLKSLWSTLEEAYAPLDEYAMTATMHFASGLNLPPGWFTWFAAAVLFGEEPITTLHFMRMFPYGLARLNEECFASAAQQGYLIAEEGKYRLSEKAAEVVRSISHVFDGPVAQLNPMPAENLQRFVNYLIRLADASSAAPEPPAKWLSAKKRKNMIPGKMNPGVEASLPRLVIYYFDQVAAYRDDAYVTAWMTHQVEGHAWEALDRLYSIGSGSLGKLAEELHSGIPREVYAQDLLGLANHGWVREEAGVYQITNAGKQVREDAEMQTELYFFAPWSCLGESELVDLANLATQLRDGLNNIKS